MAIGLNGKRVLILGAETEIGRVVTTAVAEAGASVAAVAATSDAEAAFAVQRLARRVSSGERRVIAQAIDATNEAAVRVMVRQVSKELGGLNTFVYCPPSVVLNVSLLKVIGPVQSLLIRFGAKELQRSGGGKIVTVEPGPTAAASDQVEPRVTESSSEWKVSSGKPITIHAERLPETCELITIWAEEKTPDVIAGQVFAAIAGEGG
jgi:hypothetical protein